MRRKLPNTGRLCNFAAGVVIAGAVICAGRASAEVADATPEGFSVSETAHIAAPSDKVWAVLIAPQHWWGANHTFSRNAANLTFDAKAGGCWCETMPNGGAVQHMTVVFVLPGKLLRMRGAMGPMQEMAVTTVMTWSLKPSVDGTDITLVSANGGYVKGGLLNLAPVVDRVFGEQVNRLKTYVETGSVGSLQETKP